MQRLFTRFVDKVTGPVERPDAYAQNDRRLVQEFRKLWEDFRGNAISETTKNEVFWNCLKIFCKVMASPEDTDEVIQALGDVRSFGFVVSRFFVEEMDKISIGKEKKLTAENVISFLSVGPEENSGIGATMLTALELFVSAELDADGLIDGGALPVLVKIFHAFMFFQKNNKNEKNKIMPNDRNFMKSNLNKIEYLDDDKENSSELSYSPWGDETRRLMVQASVEGILVGLSQHEGAAASLADADALQLLFHMVGADNNSDNSFADSHMGVAHGKNLTMSSPESIQQRTRALKILTMVLENDNGSVTEYIRNHKLLEVLLVVIIRFDVDTCDSQFTISVVSLLLEIMKLSYKPSSGSINLKEDFKTMRGYFWMGQLALKLTFTIESQNRSPKPAFSPLSPAFWNTNPLSHSEPLHPSMYLPSSLSTSVLPNSPSSAIPSMRQSKSFKSTNSMDGFPGFVQNDPWSNTDSVYNPPPTPSKLRPKSGPLIKGQHHDQYITHEEYSSRHSSDDTATHFKPKFARPPETPPEIPPEPSPVSVSPALLKLLDLLVSISMIGDTTQSRANKAVGSEQSSKPFPRSTSTDTNSSVSESQSGSNSLTHHEPSPLTVKDLDAVQVLQDIFQQSNQVPVQISILERFQSLLAAHPDNYSIIKDLKIVSLFIRGINSFPSTLQEQLLKLLEYTVIAVSVVPEQELLALVCEIQKHISPTMARATLSFFIKILSFDAKFKDVFREVGVLDILVDDLMKCSPPNSTLITTGQPKASHRSMLSGSDADPSSSSNTLAIPTLTLDVPVRSRTTMLRSRNNIETSKLAARRTISSGSIPDATGSNVSTSCFFGNELSRNIAWECLLALLPRSLENQRVFRQKKGFEAMLPLLACKIQRPGVLNALHVLIIEDSLSEQSEEFALVMQAVRRGNVSSLTGKSFRLDFLASREILWSIWRMLGSSPSLQESFAKVDGYQLSLSMLNSLKNSENSNSESNPTVKPLANPIPAPPVRLSAENKSALKSVEIAQITPGASPLKSPVSGSSPPLLSLDTEMRSELSSESLTDLASIGNNATSPKDPTSSLGFDSSTGYLSTSAPLSYQALLTKHASGMPRVQSHSAMSQTLTHRTSLDPQLLNKMELVEALLLVILRATKDNPSNRIVLKEKLHVDVVKKIIPATGLLSSNYEEKLINLFFDVATETVRQPSGMSAYNDEDPPWILIPFFDAKKGQNSTEDNEHSLHEQIKHDFDCNEYVKWIEEGLEAEKERNSFSYHSCVFNAGAVQLVLEILSILSHDIQIQILGTIYRLALMSPRNLESLTSIGAIGIILDSMKSHLSSPNSPLVFMGFHIIELLGTFRLSSSELRMIMMYMRKSKENLPMDLSHRVLTLMERMANPNKQQFKNLSLCSFIHFDFSRMGYSCIQIPLADRPWPPQNGYTLSCWIKFQGLKRKNDHSLFSEDESISYSRRSSDSNHSSSEHHFPVNQKYILRLFSISSTDEQSHPSTEILINSLGNIVLVNGQSSKLVFNEISLNDGVWYNIVIVHNKPVALSGIFHSSPASLYIDGSLGQSGKLGYSAIAPGKTQQITIGTNQEYSNVLPLTFELGPTYLFEETLSSSSVFFLYLFGRGYRGVFQDTDLPRFLPIESCNAKNMMIVQNLNAELSASGGLPPGLWEFASEENAVYGSQFKDGSHVSWNGKAHPAQVMNNLSSKKMIFKIDGSTAETCPPCLARSLVNIVDALSSAASFASIPQLMDLIGDIQICTPSSFSQNLRKIGGIAVVLTMTEISESQENLHLSLSLLLNCLLNSPSNAMDMARIRGYHLLALFLYQKTSLLGLDCLETILKIAGNELTEAEIKLFGLNDGLGFTQSNAEKMKISPTVKISKPAVSSPFLMLETGLNAAKSVSNENDMELDDGKINTLVLFNEDMVKDVLLDWTIWVKAKTDIQIKLLDFFEKSMYKNKFCYHNTIFLRRIKAVQLLLVVLQRGDVEIVVLEKIAKFLGLILENSFDPAELKIVSDFIVMTFKPSREEVMLNQERMMEGVGYTETEKDEKGERMDREENVNVNDSAMERAIKEENAVGEDKNLDVMEMAEKISERNSNFLNTPRNFSILSNKIMPSVPRKGGKEAFGMHVTIRNILLEMLVKLQMNIHSDERYDVWHRLVSTKVINYFLDEEVHASTVRWVIVLLGGCLSAPSAFALRFKISGGYQELLHVLPTFAEESEIYFLLIAIMYGQSVYPRLKQVRLLDFYGLLTLKAEGEELQFVELLDSIVAMFKIAVQKNSKVISSINSALSAEGQQILSASEALRVLVEAQFGKHGILSKDNKQGSFRSNSSRHKSHPMPSAASLPLQGGLSVGSNLAMGLLRFMVDASKACGGLSSACRRQEFLESCTELYFHCVRSALSHHVKSKSVDENGFLVLLSHNSIDAGKPSSKFGPEAQPKPFRLSTSSISSPHESAQISSPRSSWDYTSPLNWFSGSKDGNKDETLSKKHNLSPSLSGEGLDEPLFGDESITSDMLLRVHSGSLAGIAPSVCASATLDLLAESLAGALLEQSRGTQLVEVMLDAVSLELSTDTALVFQGLCLVRLMSVMERRLVQELQVETLERSKWTANLESLSTLLVDRAYLGAFAEPGATRRVLEFLLAMLRLVNLDGRVEEAQPQGKSLLMLQRDKSRALEPFVHVLLKNVNRMVMFSFLPPLLAGLSQEQARLNSSGNATYNDPQWEPSNMDRTLNSCDALQLVLDNRKVALCPSNTDPEFMCCLVHNLIEMLWDDSNESVKDVVVDVWKLLLSVRYKELDELLSFRNSKGHTIDVLRGGFDKIRYGKREFFKWLKNAEDDVQTVLDQHASPEWMEFMSSATKFPLTKLKPLEARRRKEMARRSKDMGRALTKHFTQRSSRLLSLESVRHTIAIELRIRRHDKYGWILHAEREWQSFLLQLVHERGIWPIWGGYDSENLVRWELCDTEGPFRMRKKLARCRVRVDLSTSKGIVYPGKEMNGEEKFRMVANQVMDLGRTKSSNSNSLSASPLSGNSPLANSGKEDDSEFFHQFTVGSSAMSSTSSSKPLRTVSNSVDKYLLDENDPPSRSSYDSGDSSQRGLSFSSRTTEDGRSTGRERDFEKEMHSGNDSEKKKPGHKNSLSFDLDAIDLLEERGQLRKVKTGADTIQEGEESHEGGGGGAGGMDNGEGKESSLNLIQEGLSEVEDGGEQLIRPHLEPGEKIKFRFNCERVVGLDKRDGIFLIGEICLYVIENYYLDESGRICEKNEGEMSVLDQALGVDISNASKTADVELFGGWKETASAWRDSHSWGSVSESLDVSESVKNQSQSQGRLLSHDCRTWKLDDVNEILKRRYQLRPVAIELFSMSGVNDLLVFHINERDVVLKRLHAMNLPRNSMLDTTISGSTSDPAEQGRMFKIMAKTFTKRWQDWEISTFQYLMHLNTLAGRGYNDLTQYPVFPWVLADYESEELDFSEPLTYRDLSKPMGCLSPQREAEFKKRYESWDDPEIPKFHYGSHYSSAGIVLYFLIRLPPFSNENVKLQGGHFDHADRLFSNISETWRSASTGHTADVKELTPEFYYNPKFLENRFHLDLGMKQSGEKVEDVFLPPWANGSSREFVRKHREALESEYVSDHIHNWIDLIFGYKQKNQAAVDATNVFFYLTYEGAVDIDAIRDTSAKKSILAQINSFGQTPRQLFLKPHPKRKPKPKASMYHALRLCDALQPMDLNTMLSPVTQFIYIKDRIGLLYGQSLMKPPLYDKYLSWGFYDGSLRVFEQITDRLISMHEAVHDDGPIQCVDVSRDGNIFVTGGRDGIVAVWRYPSDSYKSQVRKLTLMRMLCAHTDTVTSLAISQPWMILVSGSDDRTVIVWDLNSLEFIRQLSEFSSPVSAVKVNETTGDIITAAGAVLAVWSINGDCLAIVNSSTRASEIITCVTMPMLSDWMDTGWYITGHKNGSIKIWTMEKSQDPQIPLPKRHMSLSHGSIGHRNRLRSISNTLPPSLSHSSASLPSAHNASHPYTNNHLGYNSNNGGGGGNALVTAPSSISVLDLRAIAEEVMLERTRSDHLAMSYMPHRTPEWQLALRKDLIWHTDPITALFLTSDMRSLYSGDNSGRVTQWSLPEENLKEHLQRNFVNNPPICSVCRKKFAGLERKYFCCNCGKMVCGKCCSGKLALHDLGYFSPVKVCAECYDYRVAMASKASGIKKANSLTLSPSPSINASPVPSSPMANSQRHSQRNSSFASSSSSRQILKPSYTTVTSPS